MSRDCRRPSSVSRRSLGLLISAFLLGACGGTPDPGAKFTVGGIATGLLGTGLVLQNNAGDDLAVAGNGTFTFHTALASGAGYAVTIKAQPTFPAQTCAVTNATGTVGSGNVTDVAVTCTTNTYSVGGTVTGLTGQELVLQNNAGDDLTLAANGSFTFATRVASGSSYSVTVRAQPTSPRQTCVVANATATVAISNITDVAVTCTTNTYSVGGVVTGLAGSGLLLQNNFGDDLLISGNGTFTFATAMQAGSPYAVTVKAQPTSPFQTCIVANASGTVTSDNVLDVAVICAINAYSVGGTVSGLAGSGLVLRNNAGEDLGVASNGAFTFATSVLSGGSYSVSVRTQPSSPSQTCVVANATGTVGGSAVTDVAVTCTTNSYSVGGTVSGLAGSGLVLQNNAGDDLAVTGNGAFTFTTSILSEGSYSVSVKAQPTSPTQTCAVTNGTGTVGGSAITNVAVTCTTNTYSVGGAVSGLAGSGLVLRNNAGDDLAVTSNGAFTFATAVPSGGSYSVSVRTQPSSPAQTCVVANGTGTMGSGAITGVAVTCTTNSYSVGGTVSGLLGTGLVLQNNLGDDLPITSNGAFTFATRLTSGSGYSVTVKTQPTAPIQACTVTNATGTGTTVPVTSVQVTCPTPRFVDNLDGTVTDNETGRMWMQDIAPEGACGGSGCTQAGGIAYCNNLVLAGHSDWRLPNIADMRSFIQGCPASETGGACLADDTTCATTSCACAGCAGPGPGVNGYFMDPVFRLTTWPPSGIDGLTGTEAYLATPTSGAPSLAWAVYYTNGNLNGSNGNWKIYSARCVRP